MNTWKHILTAALCFTLAGCESAKEAPRSAAAPVEVSCVTLKTETVNLSQELAGRVSPALKADVRPQVDGIIEQLMFKEGQFVEAGQSLYTLNADTYQAAFDQAQAALKSAQANITAARLKSQRYADLAKDDGISAQDLDDAKAAYGQAQAAVEEKKAQVESARINLERCAIKAPISGYVGISNFTAGALVTANQADPLVVIRAVDTVYVDIAQSGSQVLRLRSLLASNMVQEGSADVRLKLEDGRIYKHVGKLQLREVAVDESTGAVTLRAEFANPEGMLLPGMYVTAVVDEAINSNGLLVNQQAVTRNAKGQAVVMVVENSKAQERIIETGQAMGNQFVVVSGLAAGEQVIMEGLSKVRTGTQVAALPFQATVAANESETVIR